MLFRFFKTFFFIFLVISFVSCSKEEPLNVDITSTTISVTDLVGGENSITEMTIDTNVQFLVIRNQIDFNNLVKGTYHPSIDFTIYQLVIGQYFSNKKINSFTYKLYNSREMGFYKLYVSPNNDNDSVSKETYQYFFQVLVPAKESIEFLKVTFSSN